MQIKIIPNKTYLLVLAFLIPACSTNKYPRWTEENYSWKLYPEQLNVIGIGMNINTGNKSDDIKIAKNQARAEIARYLSTRIKSKFKSIETESDNKYSSSTKSEVDIISEMDLSFVKIDRVFWKKDHPQVYALAILKKQKMREYLVGKLSNLLQSYTYNLKGVEQYIKQNKMEFAINLYNDCLPIQEKIKVFLNLYSLFSSDNNLQVTKVKLDHRLSQSKGKIFYALMDIAPKASNKWHYVKPDILIKQPDNYKQAAIYQIGIICLERPGFNVDLKSTPGKIFSRSGQNQCTIKRLLKGSYAESLGLKVGDQIIPRSQSHILKWYRATLTSGNVNSHLIKRSGVTINKLLKKKFHWEKKFHQERNRYYLPDIIRDESVSLTELMYAKKHLNGLLFTQISPDVAAKYNIPLVEGWIYLGSIETNPGVQFKEILRYTTTPGSILLKNSICEIKGRGHNEKVKILSIQDIATCFNRAKEAMKMLEKSIGINFLGWKEYLMGEWNTDFILEYPFGRLVQKRN